VPYNIFSLVGVGVSNKDLAKIPLAGSKDVGDKNFVARVKGKILLQVQGRDKLGMLIRWTAKNTRWILRRIF